MNEVAYETLSSLEKLEEIIINTENVIDSQYSEDLYSLTESIIGGVEWGKKAMSYVDSSIDTSGVNHVLAQIILNVHTGNFAEVNYLLHNILYPEVEGWRSMLQSFTC